MQQSTTEPMGLGAEGQLSNMRPLDEGYGKCSLHASRKHCRYQSARVQGSECHPLCSFHMGILIPYYPELITFSTIPIQYLAYKLSPLIGWY